MTYMETINHPNYRAASLLIHIARKLLQMMGLDEQEVNKWATAMASNAGNGVD